VDLDSTPPYANFFLIFVTCTIVLQPTTNIEFYRYANPFGLSFTECEGSLPYSQQPTKGRYPEQDECNKH
jgi:hypothetical protein